MKTRKKRRLLSLLLTLVLVLGLIPVSGKEASAATMIPVTYAPGEHGTGEAIMASAPQNLEYALIDNPFTGEDEHYVFAGWIVPGFESRNYFYGEKVVLDSSCTITADWDKVWFFHAYVTDTEGNLGAGGVVTFGDEQWGSEDSIKPLQKDAGETPVTVSVYAKADEGYEFAGFRKGEEVLTGLTSYDVTDKYGNVTTIYTVNIDAVADTDVYAVFEQKKTEITDVTLYLNSPMFGRKYEEYQLVNAEFSTFDTEYTIEEAYWYSNGGIAPQVMNPEDAYFAEVTLQAAFGYEFTAGTRVEINGEEVFVNNQNGSCLSACTAMQVWGESIDSVPLSIDLPENGDTWSPNDPVPVSSTNPNFDVTDFKWMVSSQQMVTSAFEAGKSYYAEITLHPHSWYGFAAQPTVTLSNIEGVRYTAMEDGGLKVITGTYTVPAVQQYDLWVNGERFTAEKTEIACGNGTAVYDRVEKTLTLTNAEITERDYESGLWGVVNSRINDLTIVLVGENRICPSSQYSDGIDSGKGCNITITGEGSLTIDDAYYGTYLGNEEGNYDENAGDLVLDGVSFTVNNSSCAGVWANHDIWVLNGAELTVNREAKNGYNGIVSNTNGTILIVDSKVNVTNAADAILMGNRDESEHSFILDSGEVNLTVLGLQTNQNPGEAIIKASENPNSDYGYGIKIESVGRGSNEGKMNGNIEISGGTLKIQSVSGGTNLSEDDIEISDSLVFISGDKLTDDGLVWVQIWPFSDVAVSPGKWSYEGIRYVFAKGIMSGDADTDGDGITTFRPNGPVTRGQFILTLYRLAGSPAADGDNPFTDVKPNKYYTDAVIWAYKNKITTGTSDTTFEPNKEIKRQQIAAMLMRFAAYMHFDTTNTASITGFPDYDKVSSYARTELSWAYGAGIITGKNMNNQTFLAPKDNTTRKECAAMLQRFMQKYME